MSNAIVNCQKLQEELTSAGIQSAGCNSNGIVWDVDGATEIQNRADVRAVLDAHDMNSPAWGTIRAERNKLLSECDWTQLQDASLSANEKEMWASYRQLLKDIPQTYSNTVDVVYPKKPKELK
jgi:hypothetical protein